ncbi:twin-arginine translocation signal domain-containing protein [Streptomyces bobili]
MSAPTPSRRSILRGAAVAGAATASSSSGSAPS